MRNFYKLTMACLVLAGLNSCGSKDGVNPGGNNNGTGTVDNTLHLAFKTPDWERKIDCTHLDLDGYGATDSTVMVSAESASTKETFYFTYPKDSSVIVKPANLKRYAITVTGANRAPFEFSQKLPVTEGSTTKLISEEGLSAQSYNEVTDVKYVGRAGTQALFQVKCKYSMIMHPSDNESTKKTVTGTFHFKIKTSRK